MQEATAGLPTCTPAIQYEHLLLMAYGYSRKCCCSAGWTRCQNEGLPVNCTRPCHFLWKAVRARPCRNKRHGCYLHPNCRRTASNRCCGLIHDLIAPIAQQEDVPKNDVQNGASTMGRGIPFVQAFCFFLLLFLFVVLGTLSPKP